MSHTEKCPRIEAISALVDDELAESDRAALSVHVQGCPMCAPVLAEFRQLRSSFAALPDVALDVDLDSLVDRRIVAHLPKPRRRAQRWRWWEIAPVAFGGALSLSMGIYLGNVLMPGAQAEVQPMALRMAAFDVVPPGSLCLTPQACNMMSY